MREVALVSRGGAAGSRRSEAAQRTLRYRAFLSYSHKDSETADWLHSALERYRVPRALVGRQTKAGAVPPHFNPIFRDRHELAASGDLGHTIREALAASRALIVLCSPDAAQSRWTNEEILAFKKLHPTAPVLAAIVAGEPFASEMPGREAEECFPPALRQRFDSRGRLTSKRAEPVAADLRATGDGRQLGLLKIVAGLLDVGLDDLVRRDQQRKQRRLTYIAAASLAGMVLTSGLAVFAFDKRDEARDQRREAEGLVGFMLGDLRDKLEPIGELDALDSVGARALEYFEQQDKSELSEDNLAQRSRALTLMGEIATARGDLDGALRRYREAMAGTGEMVRRAPEEPQRLFDHAQNVFWVGEIAAQRGRLKDAEEAMREYKRLADRMVAIEANNPKWKLEVKYADTNLGILLYKQRRYAEASRLFRTALATVESLAAADPRNSDYQKSIPETLAWLGDSQFGEGKLDEAIAKRERQVALLDRLIARSRDVEYRQKAIPAHRALGRWLASRGSTNAGLEHSRKAVQVAIELIPTEPGNMVWVELAAGAQLDLALILLSAGRADEAAVHARSGCDKAQQLAARDPKVVVWRSLVVDCFDRRARLASHQGAHHEAVAMAEQALAAARSFSRDDPAADRFAIAGGHKLSVTFTARPEIAIWPLERGKQALRSGRGGFHKIHVIWPFGPNC